MPNLIKSSIDDILSEIKSLQALLSSAPTCDAEILKNPALVTGKPGFQS